MIVNIWSTFSTAGTLWTDSFSLVHPSLFILFVQWDFEKQSFTVFSFPFPLFFIPIQTHWVCWIMMMKAMKWSQLEIEDPDKDFLGAILKLGLRATKIFFYFPLITYLSHYNSFLTFLRLFSNFQVDKSRKWKDIYLSIFFSWLFRLLPFNLFFCPWMRLDYQCMKHLLVVYNAHWFRPHHLPSYLNTHQTHCRFILYIS